MLDAQLAARIGRSDLAQNFGAPTGTTVNPGGNVGASLNIGTGGGTDSLILLAALVIGIFAFSYWTR